MKNLRKKIGYNLAESPKSGCQSKWFTLIELPVVRKRASSPERSRRAFTLIELLVVATIIAVLAAVAVVSYSNAKSKSRDARRVSDLASVKNAINMYAADMNSYPANPTAGDCGFPKSNTAASSHNGGIKECLTELEVSGYMDSLPNDPQPTIKYYSYFNYSSPGYFVLFANTENVQNNPNITTLTCKNGTQCFTAGSASHCRPKVDGDSPTEWYRYCLFDVSK